MTLEQIQKRLTYILDGTNPNTKIGRAVEIGFIAGLAEAGVNPPPICAILIASGRSITLFKPKPDSK